MEENNDKCLNILPFIAGGLLGAGIALLLAPQSGKRTRRNIAHLGAKARNKLEAMQLDLSHAVGDMVDDISEKLLEDVDKGREWSDKKVAEIQRAFDSGKKYIGQEIDRIRSAWS